MTDKTLDQEAEISAPKRPRPRRVRKSASAPLTIEAVAIPVVASAAAAGNASPEGAGLAPPEADAGATLADRDARAVDLDALAAKTPAPEKPSTPPWMRMRRAAALAERHAFTVASLSLSLGIGWLVGAHTFNDFGSIRYLATGVERIDLRVESLARQVAADAQGSEIASLKKSVAALTSALETSRRQSQLDLASMQDRLAAASREPAARLQSVMQRLEAVEKRAADPLVTASIAPAREPRDETVTVAARSEPAAGPRFRPGVELPPLLPQSVRSAIPPQGYVLRKVTNGIAFLESREGLRTVEPGQILPGAGRVTKIEKRGQNWVVVTSRGVIDSELY